MKKYKGFTILEVLVVSLIAGIVGIGTVSAIAQSNKVVNETTLHVLSSSSIHNILTEIARDVRGGYAMQSESAGVLVIHHPDGSWSQWNTHGPSGGMINTTSTGRQRIYRILGTRDWDGYKITADFLVNTDHLGNTHPMKYHKLDVNLTLETDSGYRNETISSTFYCKHVASFYGWSY